MNFNEAVDFIGRSLAIVIPFLVWSLIWKGFALWRAAVRHDKVWFIALLLVNTAGLLEILYLFVFSKREALNLESVSAEPESDEKNQI